MSRAESRLRDRGDVEVYVPRYVNGESDVYHTVPDCSAPTPGLGCESVPLSEVDDDKRKCRYCPSVAEMRRRPSYNPTPRKSGHSMHDALVDADPDDVGTGGDGS